LRVVERNDIDIAQWNQLVASTKEASFFSYVWYLDAVAENWCILIDEDYSSGIALPYSVRLGIKTLYTPIFVRYLEVLGENVDLSMIQSEILQHFKHLNFSTKQKIFQISTELVFQVIENKESRRIGSQAKRMFKKAEKNELVVTTSTDYSLVHKIILAELTNKHQGLNDTSLKYLEQLFKNAEQKGVLQVYQLKENGGVVCLRNEQQTLYLKGAVEESIKKNGGMYSLINQSVIDSLNQGCLFDFGGSNAKGVQQFNHNLGGKNVIYYYYQTNKYPWWFKIAKSLNSFRK